MKKHNNILGIVVLWLSFAGILAVVYIPSMMRKKEEKSYKSLLMGIPGVMNMKGFSSHEGYRFVDLVLDDGIVLTLGGFDKSSFVDAKRLDLSIIRDVSILCKDRYDAVIGSFDLIEAMHIFSRKVQVRNIKELVENHEAVYDIVKQNFPEGQANPRKIQLGGEEFRCSLMRVPSGRELVE